MVSGNLLIGKAPGTMPGWSNPVGERRSVGRVVRSDAMCINRGVRVGGRSRTSVNGEGRPTSANQTRRTTPGISRPQSQSQYLLRPSVAIPPPISEARAASRMRGPIRRNPRPRQEDEKHSARPARVWQTASTVSLTRNSRFMRIVLFPQASLFCTACARD